MKHTALALVLLLVPSCLAKELRTPAAEHAEQTQIVAMRCEMDYYGAPCPTELLLDLQETAKQAMLISDIVEQGPR